MTEPPCRLYFTGAEQPGWQRLLFAEGVRNVGVSFMYFYRKRKKSNWVLPDFPEGTSVLLDAGGFGANKNPGQLDPAGWRAYEESYCEFVDDNLDRIDIVGEFDLQSLGHDHIKGMRESYWDGIGAKFMPIWHPVHGMDELERLARRYDRVGVTGAALNELSYLGGRINTLSRQWDTKFHGMALTRPDVLRNIHFATAASTSWISPSRYGDTQVWDGQRLKRYPKDMKIQARKRHRMAFERAGFDARKILADDPIEITRFTVWSWKKFEETLAHHRGLTPLVEQVTQGLAQPEGGPVDPRPLVTRPEGVDMLPVMNFDASERLTILAPAESVRVCDNCYVASNCPAYRPQAPCAYGIPVEMKTREQILSVLYGVIEMQTQRVLFGRFTEEREGGYPDPNLSGEMDRLMRFVKELKDIEDNRDVLKVNVEARTGAGVLSRIFGEKSQLAPRYQAIEASVVEVEPDSGE